MLVGLLLVYLIVGFLVAWGSWPSVVAQSEDMPPRYCFLLACDIALSWPTFLVMGKMLREAQGGDGE